MDDRKKSYHHNYYVNYYKDIIKDKKAFCHCCQIEVSAWNLYKHKQSRKHAFNSLSEEEKQNREATKQAAKIKKQIETLEATLGKIENDIF